MRSYRHEFTNSQGVKLSARLDMPADDKPAAYALFAHCFTGSKNWNAVKNISRALIQADIAVFRFDFMGLGESEGEFADSNFSSNVSDIVDAALYMEAKGMPPQILIGHSLGGAASIMASPKISTLRATVTIGSPADPAHVQHLFDESIEQIEAKGEAHVTLGGRKFTIKKQFIDDLEKADASEVLKSLGKALLVLHSPQDKTVNISNAAKLFSGAKHPKSFVTLDGADHLLTQKEDSMYAGFVIASWASRYIDRDEDILPESDMRIAAQTEEDYYTSIKAGQFMLAADRPKRLGGSEVAPSPYDLLMSSLGSSTSMTIRHLANENKQKISLIKVHLEPQQPKGDKKTKLLSVIRVIEVSGMDIKTTDIETMAGQCPVFLLLKSSINISTEVRVMS